MVFWSIGWANGRAIIGVGSVGETSMIGYQAAKDSGAFHFGVVTYLDGDDDAVTAEGYVSGDVMNNNDESVVIVAEPENTLQLPFDRVLKIRYPSEE